MHADAGHRRNNFDFLRIVAALMVLISHAYALLGREAMEPLARHTGLAGLSELGVSIFFVISGFLVAASFARLPNIPAYMASRLLRLIPALAAATVLTAFVLGPLVTALAPADYFARPSTWLYPVRNVLLYPVTYLLPGVFETNPYPGAVNGSLWTLRLEFTCYLLIPALAVIGRFDRASLTVLAVLGAALHSGLGILGAEAVPGIVVLGVRFGFLFTAGAALYGWRDSPAVRGWWGVALALAVIVATAPSERWAPWISTLAIPFAVIGFALKPLPVISSWSRLGDYSYGVYIYAFPVQQTLILLLGPGRLGVPLFIGLAVAATAPLAVASWLLVEQPALGLKGWARARLARFERPRLDAVQAPEPGA